MKPEINYIFACGFRCYSTFFLKYNNLRFMSSPFDWIIIDLESVLKIINSEFKDYLNDIVEVSRNKKICKLHYKKNHIYIDNSYKKIFINNFHYMKEDYSEYTCFFNHNYLETVNATNLYFMKNICEFRHYNMTDNNDIQKLQKRCDRFKNIINKYSDKTALFYITRIFDSSELIKHFLDNIIKLKKEYKISLKLIIIIYCSDKNLNEYHTWLEDDNIFYITKKCRTLEEFCKNNMNDNFIDESEYKHYYKKEFDIINDFFNIKIYI